MFQRKPKILRSDNGGEYIGNKLVKYMKPEGVKLQITVSYSPPQNGLHERRNRTIIEMAKCMSSDAELSQQYWGDSSLFAE